MSIQPDRIKMTAVHFPRGEGAHGGRKLLGHLPPPLSTASIEAGHLS